MKERILKFLKAENKSSAQFAEEIGVQPSGISHILSGRNNPSLDFILKMLAKYQFISTDWLLFGRGDMYRSPEMQNLFDEALELDKNVSENKENLPDGQDIKAVPSVEYENKIVDKSKKVDKIVWFYSDSSFREYMPGKG